MSHVYCEVNENMEQIFIISIISCQVPSVLFICDVKYLFEFFFILTVNHVTLISVTGI